MIQGVVFDYGGVIATSITPHLTEFESQQGYARGAMFQLLFGENWLDEVLDDDLSVDGPSVVHDWHRLETGELDIMTFIEGARTRAPEVLGRDFDVDAFAMFMAGLPLGVHWPVVHRLRELRADGLALALLTNNVKEFGSAWRATFPVVELFDVIVDSSEVGMRKPDPRIYRLTCDQLSVDPEAAVFLDDLPVNVAAARAVGMEAVRVDADIAAALAELDAILTRRGIAPSEVRS
jgi:putative hydrolase of the HAD superfamily